MRPRTSEALPLVVAFASGKGGVGKTMLAVAFASELARDNDVLLLDLDFWNRGLTGLFRGATPEHEIAPPSFLAHPPSGAGWGIAQVSGRVRSVVYPDVSSEQLRAIEEQDVEILADELREFVERCAQVTACDCVVLDCHGGPDQVSIAAALVADHTLIVSEPDRITFYGTLNFLRRVRQEVGDPSRYDLRLVFNKVLPAFSGLFLRTFYNRQIRRHFGGNPLLGLYPLEIYLTKEFERTAFVTEVYPDSHLARKTRVLIGDLLGGETTIVQPAAVASIPRWRAPLIRLGLGRRMPLFDPTVAMATVAFGYVIVGLAMVFMSNRVDDYRARVAGAVEQVEELLSSVDEERLADSLARTDTPAYQRSLALRDIRQHSIERRLGIEGYPPLYTRELTRRRQILLDELGGSNLASVYPEPQILRAAVGRLRAVGDPPTSHRIYDAADDYGEVVLAVVLTWLLFVFFMHWGRTLDVQFTYRLRKGHLARLVLVSVAGLAMWGVALALVAVLAEMEAHEWFVGIYLLILSIATIQTYRVYRQIRYERRRLEGALRLAFVAFLVVGPFALRPLLTVLDL